LGNETTKKAQRNAQWEKKRLTRGENRLLTGNESSEAIKKPGPQHDRKREVSTKGEIRRKGHRTPNTKKYDKKGSVHKKRPPS